MRALLLGAVLVGCSEPTLPPAVEIATDVVAFASDVENVYWVGADYVLWRTEPDGTTVRLDSMPSPLEDGPILLVSGTTIVWGTGVDSSDELASVRCRRRAAERASFRSIHGAAFAQ